MKKILSIFICMCFFSLLFGCDSAENVEKKGDIMNEVPTKILFSESSNASFIEDFWPLESLVKHSDLIVEATVESVSYMGYIANGSFYCYVNLTIDKTYYGPETKDLEIRYSAGYIPIVEYEKKLKENGQIDQFQKNYSKEDIKDSFIVKQSSTENFMSPGDQFILFLDEDLGYYYTIAAAPGAMKMDGEYANQTVDGHEYKVEEVIDYITDIDKDNKPVCESCQQRDIERDRALEDYIKNNRSQQIDKNMEGTLQFKKK